MDASSPHTAISGNSKNCVACKDVTAEHLLSEEQVKTRVASRPLWEFFEQRTLRRTFIAKNFQAAMAFVVAAGELAEQEQHHPDLHITNYRTVTVELFTHKINGIAENDFILADLLDGIPVDYSPKWLKEHPEATQATSK